MDPITMIQVLIGIAIGAGVIYVKRDYNMGNKTACVFFMAAFTVYAGWFAATGSLCATFVVFAAVSHWLSGTATQRA